MQGCRSRSRLFWLEPVFWVRLQLLYCKLDPKYDYNYKYDYDCDDCECDYDYG